MVDTNDEKKVFALGKLRIMFAVSRRQTVSHQADKGVPVALRGGIERTPLIIPGVNRHPRSKVMHAGNSISQRVVPSTALVAVEGLIVFGVNVPAKVLPTRQREAERKVCQRYQSCPRKVLALVEFYDKRRIRNKVIAGRHLRAFDEIAMAAQAAEVNTDASKRSPVGVLGYAPGLADHRNECLTRHSP